MAASAYRRFPEELLSVIGRRVAVETSEGKEYQGELVGLDDKLNLVLDDVSGAGAKAFKIILNGVFVKEIRLIERPFDLRSLSERISRVFPGLVKLREDIGVIMVMDKFKVTENGVVEGTGLAAERIKNVYDDFIIDSKKNSS